MSEPTPAPTVAPVAVRTCPSCGDELAADALFCENCGADLNAAVPVPAPVAPADAAPAVLDPPAAPAAQHDGTLLDDLTAAATDMARRSGVAVVDADLTAVPTTCASCQGTIAADGYCEQCGTPAPKARDHWRDQPSPWVAGVCDRGIRHTRNEDAMAIAAAQPPGSFAALVVCDGVSSAKDSDIASLAAARAARDSLIAGITIPPSTAAVPAVPTADGGYSTSHRTARAGELAKRLETAAAAAQAQAAAAAEAVQGGQNPPSCTFVAALVERPAGAATGLLVTGWVGDSRAYWLPDGRPAVLMSVDDSWASEAIAQGLSRAEAERLPQAHAITRWLGVDAPDPVPRTAVQALDEPGWVLLCSDGLWNYCSEPADLAALVAATLSGRAPGGAPAHDPAALAEELTAWAIGQGGHDNITVVLVRIETQVDESTAPPAAEPARREGQG